MRRALWCVIAGISLLAKPVAAQEQFPADPVPSAPTPYISNQFMQLDSRVESPLMMHTGIDIVTGAGVPVVCPLRPGSNCVVANDLSDPEQANALVLASLYRQGGNYALLQVGHINRDPSIAQASVVYSGDPLGTVTAAYSHLHTEIALTPGSSGTMDDWLVHPQVYGFSDVQRWNVDTRTPVVDATVVHPGVSGSPTVFEVRAHDQADANPAYFNGIFEIRLFVDGQLVDDIHFDRLRGRAGGYPFSASDYYYCTDASCIPSDTNDPNKLRYKLLWNTVVGNHIWRLDVYDWNGNLLHGDPKYGLPGHEMPAVSLGGTIEDGKVHLTWRISAADLQQAGIESFSVWQDAGVMGEYQKLNADPIAATTETEDYQFTGIAPTTPDTVLYRLTAENSVGSTLILGQTKLAGPKFVDALDGYPNPASGPYTIALSLARSGAGEVAIFDLSGRRVRLIHRGPLTVGMTILSWDGRDDQGQALPNGMYLLKVHADRGPRFGARKIALFR